MRGRGRATHSKGRAPFALCLALLALLGQLFATPMHRMALATDPGEVALGLKALFGNAAVLCVQADADGGSGAPRNSRHHCDDCPLCRAGAGVHALLVPPPAPAPTRIYRRPAPMGPPLDVVLIRQLRTAFAQPRAPPLEA